MQHYPNALHALCQIITIASEAHEIYILPGGGTFADVVRSLDSQYTLDQSNTHWMAITAMEAYGYLLQTCISKSKVTHDPLNDSSYSPTIILPYFHLKEIDNFPHSWSITSDSISLYYAHLLSTRLALLKVVDGIFNSSVSIFNELSISELNNINTDIVDPKFAEIFQNYSIPYCMIINGLFPDRLDAFLKTERCFGTKIIP